MSRVLCGMCRVFEGLQHSIIRRSFIGLHMSLCNSRVVTLSHPGQHGWMEQVAAACCSLKQNGIVAVPTDTIYGIAGLAQSPEAVERIYQVKGRAFTKPISISVGDINQVFRWGKVTISRELLELLLPGPVTVVFERTLDLNPSLNPNTTLVGIRLPDDGFVQEVARSCGEPLALTSANSSGAASTLSVMEFESLWPQLDIVFDGGTLGNDTESRAGSTVVDLSCSGLYSIIRPGMAYTQTRAILESHGLKEKLKSVLPS